MDENYTEREEFTEDKFKNILLGHDLEISFTFDQPNAAVSFFYNQLNLLQPKVKLIFKVKKTNVSKPYEVWWKVKNEGEVAKKANDLRGEIKKGYEKKEETTCYLGKHYVECYIVKDNTCVAMDRIDVPVDMERSL